MRRTWWAWFLGAPLALLVACGGFQPLPPSDPPPVVNPPPPPPPPVDHPPPVTQPPATVQQVLDRVVVGMSLAQATTAVALGAPQQIPGAPASARWFGTDPNGSKWMVFVVLDANGNVARKGWSVVEDVQ